MRRTQDVKDVEEFVNEIDRSGLLDLMIDYNLTWESVYNIVKESIEEVQEE